MENEKNLVKTEIIVENEKWIKKNIYNLAWETDQIKNFPQSKVFCARIQKWYIPSLTNT
jgi:hypothetical protein